MANQQLLNVREERLSWPACFNVKESEPETRGFFLIGSRSESCVARLVEPLGRERSRCEFGGYEGMIDVFDGLRLFNLQIHQSGVDVQLRRRV